MKCFTVTVSCGSQCSFTDSSVLCPRLICFISVFSHNYKTKKNNSSILPTLMQKFLQLFHPEFLARAKAEEIRGHTDGCDVSGVLLSDVTDLAGSDGTEDFLEEGEGELLKGKGNWIFAGVHGWQGFLEAERATMTSDRFSHHQVAKEIVFLWLFQWYHLQI